ALVKSGQQSGSGAASRPSAFVRDQAVAFLVDRAELEQSAEADLGIQIGAEQVDERLARIKQQSFGGSQRRYEKALADQNRTDSMVRDDIRAQLFSEGIVKKLKANVKVDDAEIPRYYGAHRRSLTQPVRRDVRHILVKTKAEAERLERQLAKGADFATLAKRYSRDPGSRSKGGRLHGGVARGRFPVSFVNAAFALRTREISAPVHTQYGWHVIQ